jgi:uncharacterized protein with HEPN domain
MRRTNAQRVEDIVERCQLVMAVASKTMTPVEWDATIYRLSVIGTAAAALTGTFRAKRPQVPWGDAIALQALIGIPDRLIDRTAIRKAIHETVPALMSALAEDR